MGLRGKTFSQRCPEVIGRTMRNAWPAGRAQLFLPRLPRLFLQGGKNSLDEALRERSFLW